MLTDETMKKLAEACGWAQVPGPHGPAKYYVDARDHLMSYPDGSLTGDACWQAMQVLYLAVEPWIDTLGDGWTVNDHTADTLEAALMLAIQQVYS